MSDTFHNLIGDDVVFNDFYQQKKLDRIWLSDLYLLFLHTIENLL